MKTSLKRAVRIGALCTILVQLAATALFLGGCSPSGSAVGDGALARDYGTQDPCQRTVLAVSPKPGVDLAQSGTKLVNAYEGYQAIGVVALDPATGILDVTWCNAMQSEQGVVRAVNLSGLVAIDSYQTSPVGNN